jgi:hypothetical protein
VADRDLLPVRTLANALWVSVVAVAVLSAWILLDRGGWAYYTTPMRVRGYQEAHALLRPSGQFGHWLGIAGWGLLLVPVVYAIRKRTRALRRAGSLHWWLEAHIFCGIVGPALVTYHTSFRFNGLISVAYWSMIAVAASGFVGRYLYVRIPRTMRGTELSLAEVRARAETLKEALASLDLSWDARALVDRFEQAALGDRVAGSGPFFEARLRRRVRRLRRELLAQGLSADLLDQTISAIDQRAALTRRIGALERTRSLFGLWHVFHLPLVWLMFAIVALHIGLALYLGYWPQWGGA